MPSHPPFCDARPFLAHKDKGGVLAAVIPQVVEAWAGNHLQHRGCKLGLVFVLACRVGSFAVVEAFPWHNGSVAEFWMEAWRGTGDGRASRSHCCWSSEDGGRRSRDFWNARLRNDGTETEVCSEARKVEGA